MACTWFGEIRSCALNKSRNKFHQTTYKPDFRALYIAPDANGVRASRRLLLVLSLRFYGLLRVNRRDELAFWEMRR